MGATEILKYIVIVAGIIALLFGVVAAYFAFRYRREIVSAEIRRAQRSRMRVRELQSQAPAQSREPEREPAHVG